MVVWRKWQTFANTLQKNRYISLVLYVAFSWNGATLLSARLLTEREWNYQVWNRLIKIHLLHLRGA